MAFVCQEIKGLLTYLLIYPTGNLRNALIVLLDCIKCLGTHGIASDFPAGELIYISYYTYLSLMMHLPFENLNFASVALSGLETSVRLC